MPRRDFVSWNTMISGYPRNGRMDVAIKLFESMPERNVNGQLDEAARVLIECGTRGGWRDDLVHAYNTLIAGYGQKTEGKGG
ncbi:hypothetical protein PTKIN_Ptkin11bG0029600 [Pterospermum kingtungense]